MTAIEKIQTVITPLKSIDKINEIIEKINGIEIDDFTKRATNCILEAPNGVMELASDNTNFVLQQGLKVIIPNGRNADNTLNNIKVTLSQNSTYGDLTAEMSGHYFLFVDELGVPHATLFYKTGLFKNKEIEAVTTAHTTYYATDVNKMYLYTAADASWAEKKWAYVGLCTQVKNGKSILRPEQPVNILKTSDLNEIVRWRMPDYTAAVNITSSKKAPSDGLCCYQGSCNAGQYLTALVNGNSVGRITGSQQTGNTATLLFSVSKGDVISSQASYNIISEELIFYPFKGAT